MSQLKWCYLEIKPNIKVKIDQEDLALIKEHSWRVTLGTQGRARVVTSLRTRRGYKTMTLGKFLMNPPKGKQVYPRRFNEELDYRKSNLIICTLAERQRLLPKKRTQTSSKFRGVSRIKNKKLWRASIEVNGLSINLGDYKSEKEAALTYNKAAKKHFGHLAYQNPIGRKKAKRT